MLIISALRKQRQRQSALYKFETSLAYIVSSRPTQLHRLTNNSTQYLGSRTQIVTQEIAVSHCMLGGQTAQGVLYEDISTTQP